MTKVGYNYGRKMLCPCCRLHEDNQEEMLNCIILKIKCPELYRQNKEKYKDIFSSDIDKLAKISKIYQKCFEIREEVIDEKQQAKLAVTN